MTKFRKVNFALTLSTFTLIAGLGIIVGYNNQTPQVKNNKTILDSNFKKTDISDLTPKNKEANTVSNYSFPENYGKIENGIEYSRSTPDKKTYSNGELATREYFWPFHTLINFYRKNPENLLVAPTSAWDKKRIISDDLKKLLNIEEVPPLTVGCKSTEVDTVKGCGTFVLFEREKIGLQYGFEIPQNTERRLLGSSRGKRMSDNPIDPYNIYDYSKSTLNKIREAGIYNPVDQSKTIDSIMADPYFSDLMKYGLPFAKQGVEKLASITDDVNADLKKKVLKIKEKEKAVLEKYQQSGPPSSLYYNYRLYTQFTYLIGDIVNNQVLSDIETVKKLLDLQKKIWTELTGREYITYAKYIAKTDTEKKEYFKNIKDEDNPYLEKSRNTEQYHNQPKAPSKGWLTIESLGAALTDYVDFQLTPFKVVPLLYWTTFNKYFVGNRGTVRLPLGELVKQGKDVLETLPEDIKSLTAEDIKLEDPSQIENYKRDLTALWGEWKTLLTTTDYKGIAQKVKKTWETISPNPRLTVGYKDQYIQKTAYLSNYAPLNEPIIKSSRDRYAGFIKELESRKGDNTKLKEYFNSLRFDDFTAVISMLNKFQLNINLRSLDAWNAKEDTYGFDITLATKYKLRPLLNDGEARKVLGRATSFMNNLVRKDQTPLEKKARIQFVKDITPKGFQDLLLTKQNLITKNGIMKEFDFSKENLEINPTLTRVSLEQDFWKTDDEDQKASIKKEIDDLTIVANSYKVNDPYRYWEISEYINFKNTAYYKTSQEFGDIKYLSDNSIESTSIFKLNEEILNAFKAD